MEFVTIPAKTFVMGNSPGQKGKTKNKNQAEVTISHSFEMMTTEVTQQMWFDVMDENPSLFKTSKYCDNHININGEDLCPDRPVEQVSWDDIQIYIQIHNELGALMDCQETPRDPIGCYRLPTEAEWEFAALGGGEFEKGISDLKDYAWYDENSERKTHPVGLKRANFYGLHDMAGNVYEWVQDIYVKDLPGGTDPSGPVFGPTRVIRGGCWFDHQAFAHPTFRTQAYPDHGSAIIGFRLVRSLVQDENFVD